MLAAGGARAAEALPGGLSECHISGFRNGVLCGSVKRPLDPEHAERGSLEIHYVVVPALARRKLPDPVFFLAGGPGQSAIDLAPQVMALFGRLNNRRDIVFVDQRGTGRSAPLACKDPEDETLAEQAELERQQRLIMECKAALLKQPYLKAESDLGFFTTWIAVQDLDAVRRQLGAERIDLIGGSYGTRVALEMLRQFPQTVRRTVIDGVAPADMALPASFSTDNQAAFDRLAEACAAEPACAKAHPDLRARFAALLQGLPRQVKAQHPLTGAEEQFTLTRELVLGAVRGALYSPALAAALPEAIEAASARRLRRPGRPERDPGVGQGDAARHRHAPLGRLRRGHAAPGVRGRQAGQRVRHRLRREVREALRGLAARRGAGRVLLAARRAPRRRWS